MVGNGTIQFFSGQNLGFERCGFCRAAGLFFLAIVISEGTWASFIRSSYWGDAGAPPRQSQIWQSPGCKRPQPFVLLKFHLYCEPFSP